MRNSKFWDAGGIAIVVVTIAWGTIATIKSLEYGDKYATCEAKQHRFIAATIRLGINQTIQKQMALEEIRQQEGDCAVLVAKWKMAGEERNHLLPISESHATFHGECIQKEIDARVVAEEHGCIPPREEDE